MTLEEYAVDDSNAMSIWEQNHRLTVLVIITKLNHNKVRNLKKSPKLKYQILNQRDQNKTIRQSAGTGKLQKVAAAIKYKPKSEISLFHENKKEHEMK